MADVGIVVTGPTRHATDAGRPRRPVPAPSPPGHGRCRAVQAPPRPRRAPRAPARRGRGRRCPPAALAARPPATSAPAANRRRRRARAHGRVRRSGPPAGARHRRAPPSPAHTRAAPPAPVSKATPIPAAAGHQRSPRPTSAPDSAPSATVQISRPIASHARVARPGADNVAAMEPRAALVTGGSSGIGKALARVLGPGGLCGDDRGRDEAKLAAAAQELRARASRSSRWRPTSPTRSRSPARRGARGRVRAHGRAGQRGGGWHWRGAAGQLPTEMLDRHLDVDLRAMFLTIRASLAMLTAAGAEHGKALVVNVSSLAAKGGTPGMSFYAAAKAGVNALTESAQAEARSAGHPVHDLLAGLHRDADGGVDAGRGCRARGDGPAGGSGRGPALPAAHLAHVPRAGDRVHAARPARDHRAPCGLARERTASDS